MKIFHILFGKANPNTMNGVNKVVHSLATEQTRLGHDVSVVAIANNDVQRHCPIYHYHLFRKHPVPFVVPSQAVDLLLRESDENSIFHFHSAFVPWFLPLMKVLKANGKKHIVYTPHGACIDENLKSWKKRIYFSLIESRVIRSAECVHIIGYKTEANHYIIRNARKTVCIPNGFGVENIPATSVAYTHTIGALCRLYCYQKGLDLLIPAFAEYKRLGGKYALKIAGAGVDEQRLRAMIEQEGMQRDITLVGAVYDDQKWDFLRSCIAHISPSRFDVLPTACLESAAVGCIQLTAEATNMGKFVRKYDAGTVIEKTDCKQITQQLLAFDRLSEAEICAMRRGAREMIEQELNWDCIARRILTELYGITNQE